MNSNKHMILVKRNHNKKVREHYISEIEVGLELLDEMRSEIAKFYRDKENFPNEDRLYQVIGKRVVEWFDE